MIFSNFKEHDTISYKQNRITLYCEECKGSNYAWSLSMTMYMASSLWQNHSCVHWVKLQQCHYHFCSSWKFEGRFTCLFWHIYYLV